MTDFAPLRFDPSAGQVIREPSGLGYGYWVGGMKAWHDQETGKFYLFYRDRVPLELGRGGRCAIAQSADGVTFDDVWWCTKESLCAASIEVAQPIRAKDGEWRLYISYEFNYGNYWRIDVLRGPTPDALNVQSRRTVVIPSDYGLSFIKDPFVVVTNSAYRMYATGTARNRATCSDEGVVHQVSREATLLFESEDGLYFTSARYVFEPRGEGWDGFASRLGCVFPYREGFAAFYDGSASIYDAYEEGTGLAFSPDGIHFERVSGDEPWIRSPHGNVRYAYALPVGQELFVYYEYTRADQSHEMRVQKLSLA